MQSHYPASFERDMGCTEADWLASLKGAVGPHRLVIHGSTGRVELDGGVLQLEWSALPERVIAMMRVPRLAVRFRFEGVSEASRHRFMRHFDLYMQRGGG